MTSDGGGGRGGGGGGRNSFFMKVVQYCSKDWKTTEEQHYELRKCFQDLHQESMEWTHPLVRFFKRATNTTVVQHSFQDSSSTHRPMSNYSIRKIRYADKVREEEVRMGRVLDKLEIARRILSAQRRRRANADPTVNEILASVGVLLFVGGTLFWLHLMFKFVNSVDAKRRARARDKARRNSNFCPRCGAKNSNRSGGGNDNSGGGGGDNNGNVSGDSGNKELRG